MVIQQVLHLQDVKDVSFGFQTVTSDVSKLSSFFALKMVKRLFVDKSLNPTTVSTAEKPWCYELLGQHVDGLWCQTAMLFKINSLTFSCYLTRLR